VIRVVNWGTRSFVLAPPRAGPGRSACSAVLLGIEGGIVLSLVTNVNFLSAGSSDDLSLTGVVLVHASRFEIVRFMVTVPIALM
jgi:hypothetical protein